RHTRSTRDWSSDVCSSDLNYKNAITAHLGVTRRTINPGDVIDLGGGMYATCLVAGGRLLSGGSIPINNDDLNSESISLKIEFNKIGRASCREEGKHDSNRC